MVQCHLPSLTAVKSQIVQAAHCAAHLLKASTKHQGKIINTEETLLIFQSASSMTKQRCCLQRSLPTKLSNTFKSCLEKYFHRSVSPAKIAANSQYVTHQFMYYIVHRKIHYRNVALTLGDQHITIPAWAGTFKVTCCGVQFSMRPLSPSYSLALTYKSTGVYTNAMQGQTAKVQSEEEMGLIGYPTPEVGLKPSEAPAIHERLSCQFWGPFHPPLCGELQMRTKFIVYPLA